jgi:hypothetical protein
MTLADLVGAVVDQMRPENLAPAGMIVTGEGHDAEIVILPHGDLAGVSLVAWTDARGARLLWAQVSDLVTHDELDLGVIVASTPFEGDWSAHLRQAIADELGRPIRLRGRTTWAGSPHVECWITADGKDRRIGVVRLPRTQRSPATQMSTSLVGGSRPWFSVPPRIEHAG